MSEYIGLIQQGLFFGFIVALSVALLSQLLAPYLLRKISVLSPGSQSNLVFAWSTLPVVAAFLSILVALLPSLLQVLGLSSDHCLGHAEGHIHFCLIHLHAAIANWQTWVPAVLFLGLLAYIGLHLLVDIVGSIRFRKALEQYPSSVTQDGIEVLQTQTPLALSCGLFKQRIFISNGLLDHLSESELKIIVAHEKHHLSRRDVWKKLIARSFSFSHFPATRALLLDHLSLSCEQACDKGAADSAGGSVQVAEVLLSVERLYKSHFPVSDPLASAAVDGNDSMLSERIICLLNQHDCPRITFAAMAALVFIGASLLLGHDQVHDALEHLMFIFAGL